MDESDLTRQKVTQIFTFLKGFDELKNPLILRRDQFDWQLSIASLPQSSDVWCPYPVETEETPSPGKEFHIPDKILGRNIVLAVKRPKLTSPPPFQSEDFKNWIQGDLHDPFAAVTILPVIENLDPLERSRTVNLGDLPDLKSGLTNWLHLWQIWATHERPLRLAMDLFSNLYALFGSLEREVDRKELVIGDGLLTWSVPIDAIKVLELDHPLVLQTVELFFDTDDIAFYVVETDSPVELYTSLLRNVPNLRGDALAQIRNEMNQTAISPMGGKSTDTFLRRIGAQLSPRFEFGLEPLKKQFPSDPYISRFPILFVRSRTWGYARSIDQVLEGLAEGSDIPDALQRLAGTMTTTLRAGGEPKEEHEQHKSGPTSPDFELLFSKPWNPEQEEIVRRLERAASVTVQGPPGTGKTHTIANLIGHLLAHGHNVLITSHTEKALRVVRDMVAGPLQSLCLPVLGSDIESRRELERSIQGIEDRISRDDIHRLQSQIRLLRQQRQKLLDEKEHLTTQLLESRRSEYRDIVIGGRGISPSDGARELAQSQGTYEWLPGPLKPGAALPLSSDEITELYCLNSRIDPKVESQLRFVLPDPDMLPHPDDLSRIDDSLQQFLPRNIDHWERCWKNKIAASEEESLRGLLHTAQTILRDLDSMEPWQTALVGLSLRSEVYSAGWRKFLSHLSEVLPEMHNLRTEILPYIPKLPSNVPIEDTFRIAADISIHLDSGKKLNKYSYLLHADWKSIVENSSVSGHPPKTNKDFRVLHFAAELSTRRTALSIWWRQLAAEIGFPFGESLDREPELVLEEIRYLVSDALDFNSSTWSSFISNLVSSGFQYRDLETRIASSTDSSRYSVIRDHVLPFIIEQLDERYRRSRYASIQSIQHTLLKHIEQLCQGADPQLTLKLASSFEHCDTISYQQTLTDLRHLHEAKQLCERRNILLDTLRPFAPAWATAIQNRSVEHGGDKPPGDSEYAWCQRQIQEELDRRILRSPETIEKKLSDCEFNLRQSTAELIEVLSWAAQKNRTSGSAYQALISWKNTVRKMPKTSTVPGKLERLRRQAKEDMLKCRAVVPAWIMPMHRVIEHFNFHHPVFDVIIVDEASQNDILGILLFALAKKIVVVGDHEQVSPSAVGQDDFKVGQLIEEHLKGIPMAALYDGRSSIYDLAKGFASETLMLKEHFRCLPPIIEFSNQLCYDGKIRPLREASTARIGPSFVTYRINGYSKNKVNQAEAESVASLLAACISHEAYTGLTFGVISLVGEEQALSIDNLLRQHLPPDIMKKHQVLCGNSAQFQGDERDVIFLTMVDSPSDGPLKIRNEPMFRQRYNVAVSRAKDQIWLVYSLNPETDLKPGDLRFRLIQHALNPRSIEQQIEATQKLVESHFENEVATTLIRRGYRVIPQYKVGYYRIDMIVEGGGHRLAVECDGDRYHPAEKIPDDLARQAILERLGWRFIRIRGSVFYRDKEKALQPLFALLEHMGISPDDSTSEQKTDERFAELQAEIIRRAELIRMNWRDKNDDESDNLYDSAAHNSTHESSSQKDNYRANSEYGVQGVPVVETNLTSNSISGKHENLTIPPTQKRRGRPRKDKVRTSGDNSTPDVAMSGLTEGIVNRKEYPQKSTTTSSSSPTANLVQRLEMDSSSETRSPTTKAVVLDDTRSNVWYALSHWAKENNIFASWERKLVYDIGRYLSRGYTLSPKQTRQGNRLLMEAIAHGFDPEKNIPPQKNLFEKKP